MRAIEHRIIRDYLSRKRYYYIGGFVIHLLVMIGCVWTGQAILLGVIGGSASILGFELMRGGHAITRTMLTLPVTADQLGRCWRFVAFGLPAVLFLSPVIIGGLASIMLDRPNNSSPEQFVIIAMFQTLLLGCIFFALTGMPNPARVNSTFMERACAVFFGALWGFSIPAVMILSIAIPQRFALLTGYHYSAAVLLALATIAGWFRADTLVRQRVARPGEAEPKANTLSTENDWLGFGGLRYFVSHFGRIGIIMTVVITLINMITLRLLSGPSPMARAPMVEVYIAIVAFFAIAISVGQLRVLRMAPISRSVLTHFLVAWSTLTVLIAMLIQLALVHFIYGTIPTLNGLLGSLLGGLSMLIALPVILRFGIRFWILIPVMMVASLTQIPNLLATSAWSIGYLVVLLGLIWWSTYRLLGSHHPWRAGALKWPAMQRSRL